MLIRQRLGKQFVEFYYSWCLESSRHKEKKGNKGEGNMRNKKNSQVNKCFGEREREREREREKRNFICDVFIT